MADDYYALLELNAGASQAEVEDALRREQRMWSRRASNAPKMEDRQEAEKRVALLGEAKSVLTDPGRRAQYDTSRTGGPVHPFMPQIGRPIGQTPETRPFQPFQASRQVGPPPRAQAIGARVWHWVKMHRRATAAIVVAYLVLASAISADGHHSNSGKNSGTGSTIIGFGLLVLIVVAIVALRRSVRQRSGRR